MRCFAYVFVLVVSLLVAPAARAQEGGTPAPAAPPVLVPAVVVPAAEVQPSPLLTHVQQKRPAAMLPLYAGFAAVQMLDYASTNRALSSGMGREENPFMAPIVGNHAAFFALKAGSMAGAVWAGEKLWKRNRIGAIVFMVAVDSAMATVVAHNYSILHR